MIKRILQILILCTPIALFVWLLVIDIAPSGVREVSYEVDDSSPFIDRILPGERVLETQYTSSREAFTTIIDDPAYFSVHFPQTTFETIELEVLFRNNGQSVLELGALKDIFSQAFDLRPLQNLTIEEINWQKLQDQNVFLYQRHSDFLSVQEFLENLPDRSRISTYHYDLDQPFRMSSYTPLGAERRIDVSLRGFHKFVTYVKDETVEFEIVFMDMNRKVGADEVILTVRDENDRVVFEEKIEDDENIDENQLSSTRSISFSESGWEEGVYTFDLSGTSDIFWREINTNLRYVTFVNTIYIGDDVGHEPEPRGTVFYTNAKNFVFETLHADAVQNLGVGENQVQVALSHEKVRASIEDGGIVQGNTPIGDIKIVGDGKFAFSPDAFFDPDPVRLGPLTDLDALGVDYLVTTYTPPVADGDWLSQSIEFDIDEILLDENNARFTFSAPLIGELQNTVDVHAINITFKKDPLSFTEFLTAVRERLPLGL